MKKKITWQAVLKFVAGISVGILLGFLVGLFIGKALPKGLDFGQFLLHLSAALVLIIIAMPIQIILHEAGHLIFGLATGYRLISFRIGSLVLMRSDQGYNLKWMPMPGTGGQCLMTPPQGDTATRPVALYNLGGVIVNIVTAILFTLGTVALHSADAPAIWQIVMLGLAVWGWWFGIANGIPMKISGIQNDGRNLLDIRNSSQSREAFFAVLQANALLAKGVPPAQLGDAVKLPAADMDASNALVSQVLLVQYLQLLDAGQTDGAIAALQRMDHERERMLPLLRMELDCELIYAKLMLQNDVAGARALYTPQVKKYLTTMTLMDKKRTLAACLLVLDGDADAALAMCDKALALAGRFPLLGLIDLEKRLIAAVRQRCQTQEE